MKEKRYFCDYWFGRATRATSKKEVLIILSSLILIPLIGYIISYNVIMSNHGYELNSYFAETYEYLDEIANNVIKEGVGIDLLALPDDIEKYEITSENDEIIFKYYLNNKDMELADPANMTVKLFNDFSVISKEPNYSSEEDYVKNVKLDIVKSSVVTGLLSWLAFILLSILVLSICAFISQSRKNKNLKNLS